MSAPTAVVNVLDEDPDLAQQLSGPRLEQARRDGIARLMLVGAGEWSWPEKTPAQDVFCAVSEIDAASGARLAAGKAM